MQHACEWDHSQGHRNHVNTIQKSNSITREKSSRLDLKCVYFKYCNKLVGCLYQFMSTTPDHKANNISKYMTAEQDGFVLMIAVCKWTFSHFCITSLCFFLHAPRSSVAMTMRLPTMMEKSGHVLELHCQCWKVSYQGVFLIKLVPKPRLWETCASAMQSGKKSSSCPSVKLFIWPPSKEVVWENAFIFHNPPSLSYLIHISWRALEVWNCLKLIHYWIFSPRLKSLASLPHNSAPIDCLGPNISQGCTEHFSWDFLKLYQRGCSAMNPCKWCHAEWVFVRLLH